MYVLLGPPEMALPSEWSEARALINDGTYPSGDIVDILSAVLLLAWVACLWFLVSSLIKRRKASNSQEADPVDTDDTEPDEPWYRHQDAPLFDEQFSDDFPRVVVPDDMTPGDEPPDGESLDSVWGPDPITGDDSVALGSLQQDTMPGHPDYLVAEDAPLDDAMFEDSLSDAEIIDEAAGPSSEEPPMIVPVRAYYLTRTEDTLRSVSAQFLQTPRRWEELRSLNTASPGVAAAGPDTPLQVGTALALPGDPVPWGKPDPVYLWTLAEKFLFAAWGREPMPEEVAPFWRGLTSGSQLEAGPSVTPEHLAPPEFVTEAGLEPDTAPEPEPEPTPPPPEPEPTPPPEPEPTHATTRTRTSRLPTPTRTNQPPSNPRQPPSNPHPNPNQPPSNPHPNPNPSRLPTPTRTRTSRLPTPTRTRTSRLPTPTRTRTSRLPTPTRTNPSRLPTPTRTRTNPSPNPIPNTSTPNPRTNPIPITSTPNPGTNPTPRSRAGACGPRPRRARGRAGRGRGPPHAELHALAHGRRVRRSGPGVRDGCIGAPQPRGHCDRRRDDAVVAVPAAPPPIRVGTRHR